MADIPCPKCGAPSCPLTKSTRKRTVARCRANLVERHPDGRNVNPDAILDAFKLEK